VALGPHAVRRPTLLSRGAQEHRRTSTIIFGGALAISRLSSAMAPDSSYTRTDAKGTEKRCEMSALRSDRYLASAGGALLA
jgi:hypothetical protein